MKTTEDREPIDWRARLHSLAIGTEPASPFFTWFCRACIAFILFLVGSFLTVLFGGFVGLSLGIGPEQTGGTLYVLFGLIVNLIIGGALAFFVDRRSSSFVTPRLVFYSFTAPAFLVVVFLAYSVFARLIE